MPRGGPWRYRKYSRVFNVVIHPAAARAITTFGGRPLSAFLRDGSAGTGPVRARVHLYQAVPGSTFARIARAERGVPGLGYGGRGHPLAPAPADADGRRCPDRRARVSAGRSPRRTPRAADRWRSASVCTTSRSRARRHTGATARTAGSRPAALRRT